MMISSVCQRYEQTPEMWLEKMYRYGGGEKICPDTTIKMKNWFNNNIRLTYHMCEAFRNAVSGVDMQATKTMETLHQHYMNQPCECCGFTFLHLAVSLGSRELVVYYLHCNVDVHGVNNNGDTALHMAVVLGDSWIIQMLLGHGADPNAQDGLGNTPLEICLMSNREGLTETMVHLLIQYGAHLNQLYVGGVCCADILMANAKTPLYQAIQQKDEETTRRLLKSGACPDLRMFDHTALHVACITGATGCVTVLLEARADVNLRDSEGRTALHYAVLADHIDVVKLLLDHGCHYEIEDFYDRTPLDLAILEDNVEIMELLLDRGAHFGYSRKLPFEALNEECIDVLITLFHRGVIDVHEVNKHGKSLLEVAIDAEQNDFVQFLLDNGADTRIRRNVIGSQRYRGL